MWEVSWTARGTSFGFAHTFEQSVPIQATLFQSQASSTVEGVWGATEQKTGLTRSPIRTLLSDKMLQDVTCLHKLPYFGD
jgi:hypothetical protein